jgi:hypothetical protein
MPAAAAARRALLAEPPPPAEAPEQDYDAFAHEPPFRPRRNRAKLYTIAAIVAAALMLAAVAALSYFDLPALRLAGTASATPLDIEGRAERRQMASGNELLTVTGQITNRGDTIQRVPQIRAELRDAQGRTVYGWSISAPVSELHPKQSANFNSAEVDVPKGARALNLSFGARS